MPGSFTDHDRGTIRLVNRELDEVLRGLEEAVKFAQSYRFDLDDVFLALIARVESLPENQTGARKSSRWIGSRAAWQAHLARVRRVPRGT